MRVPKAEEADVILSAAHKSMGAEWPSVTLFSEFQSRWGSSVLFEVGTETETYVNPPHEELALKYDASTRAELLLVHGGLMPQVGEYLRLARANQQALIFCADS